MKLNIGCGSDEWGDVRLDVNFGYRGKESRNRPNLIGDGQNLPFKDNIFLEVKASHVLEEVPFWRQALGEWMRVCQRRLYIAVPIGDGFKRALIVGLSNLNRSDVSDAIKCRKFHSHYWIINPQIIAKILKANGFHVKTIVGKRSLFNIPGRKGRLLKFLRNREFIDMEYKFFAERIDEKSH